jgi:hypothetical protein
MGNAPQDTRDAETIMASVESEFRRAREAQRNFLDWRKKSHEATFEASALFRNGRSKRTLGS